jgi:capsular exopolysaccharide synthesis family protein
MPFARFVMSRVYQALEKAEEEKRQKVKKEPTPKTSGERMIFSKEKPILGFPEEGVKELGLPLKEETPVLIAPSHSFTGEEFRKLKTQIFLRLPNPPRSILITSAVPQEGKTMVAVNLAMAISQEINKKAILIDGDLRKPSISLEERHPSKGLSNYLLNGTPLSEILINSEIENLQIIMAGSPSQKSSELIGSKRMGELLKSLSEFGENTYIIIDSSPIISTTDPILLSEKVDGIILVIKANQTTKEFVKKSVKSLDRHKIIGIVFNQMDLKVPAYHYQYDHDSKYYKK